MKKNLVFNLFIVNCFVSMILLLCTLVVQPMSWIVLVAIYTFVSSIFSFFMCNALQNQMTEDDMNTENTFRDIWYELSKCVKSK
jgi:hypothetical protein